MKEPRRNQNAVQTTLLLQLCKSLESRCFHKKMRDIRATILS